MSLVDVMFDTIVKKEKKENVDFLLAEMQFPEEIRPLLVVYRGHPEYKDSLIKLKEYYNFVELIKSLRGPLKCFSDATNGNYHKVLVALDQLLQKFEEQSTSLETLDIWNNFVNYFMYQYRLYSETSSKDEGFDVFRRNFISYADTHVYRDEMINISNALNELTNGEIKLIVSMYENVKGGNFLNCFRNINVN